MNNLEQAFSSFLESYEADKMMGDYLTLIRTAFISGYKAAGGDAQEAHKALRVFQGLPDAKKNV